MILPSIFLFINNYIIIAFIVGFVLIIYYAMSFYVYKMLMINYNKPPVNLVDHTEDFYKESYQWFQEVPKEDVFVNSYDSLKLHGYYIPSYNKKSNNLAIVVHGYQSKATDMIIIGKMYSEMGFQVILTDLRGHGESEGSFTSFGYYEKYDLKKWINFANRTYGADIKILIHGVSMGAASTMMVTGLDIPKNVKFLLIDSGFTYVKKTFTKANRSKGLKIFYFGLNIISYLRHKFTFYQIRPIKYMKRNIIPFLLVIGEEDRVVPVSMGNELLHSSPATVKDMLVVPGSKHAQGFRADYKLCYDKLLKNIKPIFNIKKIYESNN